MSLTHCLHQFPDELSALIHCLRLFNKKDDPEHLEQLLHQGIDWDFFFQLVLRHRVTIQTCRCIQGLSRGYVDSRVLNRLKKQSALVVRRNLAMTAQLASLSQQFDDAQIPYLAIKGPAAGYDLYGNPGIRQMNDLDILIDPDEISRAEAVLHKNGFKRKVPDFPLSPKQMSYFKKKIGHHFGYIHPVNKILVELHWRLFANPVLFPVPFPTLWRHKRTIRLGQYEVFIPDLEQTFLFLSVHGSKHHWNRLFWLNDIARLLEKNVISDWPGFLDHVTEMGLERMIAEAVILSHCILGTFLPDPVKRIVSKDPGISKMVDLSLFLISFPEERLTPFNKAYWYAKWHRALLVRDVKYFLWNAAAKVSPPLLDMKNWPLPDSLFLLYYVICPFTLFDRYFIHRR